MRCFFSFLVAIASSFAIRASAQLPLKALSEMSFCYIPAGSFIMGDFSNEGFSPDELPAHHVALSAYYLSTYEITNAQYCLFLNAVGNKFENGSFWIDLSKQGCLIETGKNGYQPIQGFNQHPVVCVSWYGARAYAEWMGGRLPTEAEWEYAARSGGLPRQYSHGDRLNHNNANFVGIGAMDNFERSSPVGAFKATDLGLYDMVGNVWEWCSDWYRDDYYSQSAAHDPEGPILGEQKVMRGGSWSHSRWNCRAITRGRIKSNQTGEDIGFRVVMPVRKSARQTRILN